PLLLIAGGVAGTMGSRVWPAAPDLDMPVPASKASKLSSIQLGVEQPKDTTRPTAWVRVLVGAAVMVAGFAVADKGRSLLQKYSQGMLKVETTGQGRFLSWQFATLAALAGAGFAAAGTGAGLRHGVLAGLLGGLGVVGLCAAQGEATPPVAYWLTKLN